MKQRILYLCTCNSCRSQMAEGWTRHLKGDVFDVYSAGVKAQGMNPHAVQVMKESGVDIAQQTSKALDSLGEPTFDVVVTVCTHAAECCPSFPGGGRVICRSFDDPPKLAETAESEEEVWGCYRRVRDEIRAFVEGLPDSLMSG